MSGIATVRETHDVAARTGKAFEVAAGDLIRITDLEGSQPVDFWAFSKADHLEFLSCEHTKPSIEKLFPHVGDSAYTNRRRRIVTVVDDTSPGQHDMQYAACDPTRYAELGVEGYHESCQENLHLALDDFDEVRDYQIGPYNIIRPGNPDESSFLEKMKLPPGDSDFMPRKGDPLPAKELAIIEQWIAEGAIVDATKPTEKEQAFLEKGKAMPAEDEKQKFHNWTNRGGATIEARFVRLVDGAVTVVMKNGKSYNVPIDTLSAESQALARRLGGES